MPEKFEGRDRKYDELLLEKSLLENDQLIKKRFPRLFCGTVEGN